jgi:hypothetical protein
MIKFFGLLSKKKKVKLQSIVDIYCGALDEVISNGFIEIKDFINNNNNLENNPNLKNEDIKWFRIIIFLGNLNHLKSHFEEQEVLKLRNLIIENIFIDLNDNQKILSVESFLQYESYFSDLLIEFSSEIDAMAYAIFEKYNINDFQGTLFKRKNKPNPIFISEMKNLLKHFIWNWDEYLQKNKLQF